MSGAVEQRVAGPPPSHSGPWRWMRENLFNSWFNSILTMLSLWFLVTVVIGASRWAFTVAEWSVIPANLTNLMVGTYPRSELWRIWSILYMLSALSGLSAGVWGKRSFRLALKLAAGGALLACLPFSLGTRGLILGNVALLVGGFFLGRGRATWSKALVALWLLSFPATLLALWGTGGDVLPRVETTSWGGLTLTLLLAVVGIVLSFPIGTLLALGRQSSLPAVSVVCGALIEVVRGMPLVTILFMAHLMVPIFLPQVRIDKVVRAIIGFVIFTSAYMAENIRGGLQGVPKGQYDAARALGLNGVQTMLLIIMPQALRSVIPSIVGQFISLLKDTSLVAIVGLLDLLGIARSVVANPAWLGLHSEVFLFCAALYWLFSFSLSRASTRLERSLGIEQR